MIWHNKIIEIWLFKEFGFWKKMFWKKDNKRWKRNYFYNFFKIFISEFVASVSQGRVYNVKVIFLREKVKATSEQKVKCKET